MPRSSRRRQRVQRALPSIDGDRNLVDDDLPIGGIRLAETPLSLLDGVGRMMNKEPVALPADHRRDHPWHAGCARRLYLHLRERLLVRHQRSRRMRQLPCHGEPLSCLDEELTPRRRVVQRLPYPPGLVPKYTTKAINGFNHSLAFTTGRFPEPIRITRRNVEVTEKACRKCHADVVSAIEGPHPEQNRLSCIRCHSTVGHLE